MKNSKNRDWPLIEDLPKDEQEAFSKWLTGQTVPINQDGTIGYFPHDYERWKAGLPVID